MIISEGNCAMVLISVGIIIDHSWESDKSIVCGLLIDRSIEGLIMPLLSVRRPLKWRKRQERKVEMLGVKPRAYRAGALSLSYSYSSHQQPQQLGIVHWHSQPKDV